MRLFALILGLSLLSACSAPEGPAEVSAPPISSAKSEAASPSTPSLPAGSLEDIDFNAYSMDIASRFGLRMGESRIETIDKIRLYFAPEKGNEITNLTSATFERDDGAVLLFSKRNIADDAIFAEEIYAVFSGPGGDAKFNQKLAAFGLRIKCRRGENAMEWTTELCP